MSSGIPLRPSHQLCISKSNACVHQSKLFQINGRTHLLNVSLSSRSLRQDLWSLSVSGQIYRRPHHNTYRYNVLTCRSFALPGANEIPVLKSTTLTLARSYNALRGFPLLLQFCPAFVAIAFAVWGLEPLMRHSRRLFVHRNDATWKKSRTHYVCTSYIRPLLLWSGAILICRVLDPIPLHSEASQVVKQRLLHFVRSLSTVLAFSCCLSSLTQQVQKFLMATNDNSDARNMGFQFAGKAVYTSVWVAAVSLFMELLGFSTQKWLTAGGLGTVLLTLAGREIFTNFLSSIMIHATRPFVVNEWIQTKIEGCEVSGTVEQVGWWSPTIIRGDDREAIHIPNHKFTVNIVRNLTQKTHWRVKTHIGISHLDANKINNIVADMRKVLAKNPLVEQQRLHRRVFLEYINPENQAFMILISCFVKTSHFEEYLCVKEAILLDLLRVISHHRARLATPIRTVQKMYSDVDLENIPFADTIFTHGRAPVRSQLYLVDSTSRVNGDSTSRINGDDKTKSHPTPASEEHHKTTVTSDKKGTGSVSDESTSDKRGQQKVNPRDPSLFSVDPPPNNLEDKQMGKRTKAGDTRTKSSVTDQVTPSTSASSAKSQLQAVDSKANASEKPTDSKAVASEKPTVKPSDGTLPAMVKGKHDSESLPDKPQPVKRPSLEENIVLGMALDGAKRTLPIEEGVDKPSTVESKELAAFAKGNGSPLPAKDKKTGPASAVPDVPSADEQDKER